jgi:hypothetical protein
MSYSNDLNYSEFLKALYKKLRVDPNKKISVPILLFVNCRLIHGLRLISTSNSIFLPITNNTHGYQDLYFPGIRIEDIPLETRIQFEISILYNSGHLNRLGVVSTSLYDGNGFLRTGHRVSVQ